jgi:L-histidine Nalpha-methyltransferase
MTQPSTATVPNYAGSSFAADARAGLAHGGQKSMPPKYFYDALGFALFEAITQLPEYGLWRAERRLLDAHATGIGALAPASFVVELGSGRAAKTALLLRAMLRQRAVSYHAIDLSRAALDMTRHELSGLAGLLIDTLESDYLAGLGSVMQARPARGSALVLLLGSSLGNFDFGASVRFLRDVRAALKPGDHLLLGADLVKPEQALLAAYDDPLGVTAAFNLNLLVRMNRELDANFELTRFRHRARFNRDTRNVEMHLESLVAQTVRVADFKVEFRAGETIHSENSHKYSLEELELLAGNCGFRTAARWVDAEGQFAATLDVAV